MLKITLGEMLKRFRIEKGVEAGLVCKGLCSNALLSCFEKGTKVPDPLLFECMMERMGVPSELFSVMVSKEEYGYYAWKEQVLDAIARKNREELDKLLRADVVQTTYCNSKLEQQFICYATAICFGLDKRYSEALELIKKAVKHTIQNVDEIGNGKVLLSEMELHMLMLYVYYGVLGEAFDFQSGIVFFSMLENYVDGENLDLILRAKMYPKLCCIGMELFGSVMSDEQKLILCEKSVQLMIEDMSFHEITNVLRYYIPLLEKYNSTNVNFYKRQYEVFKDILKSENVGTDFCIENLVIESPKIYIISEYLLSKRFEKELTQEQLSEGICEPETYSRVETGKRAPSKKNLRRLAERLDMNWCYYRGELDTINPKAFELRLKQREANINGNLEECLNILKELEKQLDMTRKINIQYIQSNQYVAEYRLDKLSGEEVCSRLRALLNLTQKSDNDLYDLVYYSQTELEIVAHIAQIMKQMGQYEEGIDYIKKVISHINNSEIDIRHQWDGLAFMFRILSTLYLRVHKYDYALQIAQFVQNESVKRRVGGNLIETLDEIADCYEHMGEQYSNQYKKLYCYAFYVSDFFKIERGFKFFRKFYEEKFEPEKKWY